MSRRSSAGRRFVPSNVRRRNLPPSRLRERVGVRVFRRRKALKPGPHPALRATPSERLRSWSPASGRRDRSPQFRQPKPLRRIAEITAPFPSWPGLSRPSTSWIINTLVYYRNLIQRHDEFYANHPIYLNRTTWMAGTSPAMTKPADTFILERLLNSLLQKHGDVHRQGYAGMHQRAKQNRIALQTQMAKHDPREDRGQGLRRGSRIMNHRIGNHTDKN